MMAAHVVRPAARGEQRHRAAIRGGVAAARAERSRAAAPRAAHAPRICARSLPGGARPGSNPAGLSCRGGARLPGTCVAPRSTMRPAYITAMVSASTTASRDRLIRSSPCRGAHHERVSRRGSAPDRDVERRRRLVGVSAPLMQQRDGDRRWRMPPENWCGKSSSRRGARCRRGSALIERAGRFRVLMRGAAPGSGSRSTAPG